MFSDSVLKAKTVLARTILWETNGIDDKKGLGKDLGLKE